MLNRTENVHDNGLVELYKAIGNCSHLRTLEWRTIEMPDKSLRFAQVSENTNQCLRLLRNRKIYETLKKGAHRSNAAETEKLEKPLKIRKIRRRASPESMTLDLTFASTGEWANKEIIDKEKLRELMKGLAAIVLGLEKFRICKIKTPSNFEDIINFLTLISYVTTLYHVEFDYLNCQLSDMEVMAFAHGLTKAKQLKYFSLKVIQKPGLSEDCIEQLALVLSKLDNLSKFDVYFRRLGLHPQSMRDLDNRIEGFGNIQCCCSKESIHIYRRSDTEEYI